MLPVWLQAGFWGLVGGSALLIGAVVGYYATIPQRAIAAGAILAMIADTMIPEAFEQTHDFAGLITVLGFLAAFVLSKLGE